MTSAAQQQGSGSRDGQEELDHGILQMLLQGHVAQNPRFINM